MLFFLLMQVIIYVILMSQIEHIASELQMVEDLINLDQTLELEKRFIINLKVID